jgi:coenzyme PQQ precursor peptide PqqA
MTLTPVMKDENKQTIREREVSAEPAEPKPWTAPDFVERSTCAEIGAYAFQDK